MGMPANAPVTLDIQRGIESLTVLRGWLSVGGEHAIVLLKGEPGNSARGSTHVLVDARNGTGELCLPDVDRGECRLRVAASSSSAWYNPMRSANGLGITGLIADGGDILVAVREGRPRLHFHAMPLQSAAHLMSRVTVRAPAPDERVTYRAVLEDGRELVIARDFTAHLTGRAAYTARVCFHGVATPVQLEVREIAEDVLRFSAAGCVIEVTLWLPSMHPDHIRTRYSGL